jgi:hypothetical protein
MTIYNTAEKWETYLAKINGTSTRDLCKYTPLVQDLNDSRQLNDYDRGVWYVLQQIVEAGITDWETAEDIFIDHYINDPETGSIKDRERLCWYLVTRNLLSYDEADYMVDGLTLLEARHLVISGIDCECSICED